MIGFLQSLADFFGSIIDFVVSIFMMIVNLFLLIPKGLTYIVTLVGYLPDFMVPVIIVSVSVSALLMVVNHGGD